MAALPGFEPRLTESESAVLPLDDKAIYLCESVLTSFQRKVKYFLNTLFIFQSQIFFSSFIVKILILSL